MVIINTAVTNSRPVAIKTKGVCPATASFSQLIKPCTQVPRGLNFRNNILPLSVAMRAAGGEDRLNNVRDKMLAENQQLQNSTATSSHDNDTSDIIQPAVTINKRSAEFNSKTLPAHLLPWQHAFDFFSKRQINKPLFNECVQPRWYESVQDPGLNGPFKVREYFIDLKPESTGRTLNAQVMAPAQFQKSTLSPVVLISPPCFVGELKLPFNQRFYDIQPYISFMKQFASMGFVAVGLFEHRGVVFEENKEVDHKRDAEELKSITDQLLGDSSPIQERIDTESIAVMGHSKGGKMAFYQAAIDSRVKLVLAIDPVNMGGPPFFVSRKFSDHPVVPIPGITPAGDPCLMDQVQAKSVIMRAPPDFINFDSRFNAEHFWRHFKGNGLYIDCKATHGDWILRQDLRLVTRRVFTAALMDVFHKDKPFANELRACEIKGKSPHLIKTVEMKKQSGDGSEILTPEIAE